MTTDTTERGLERLICTALTGSPCDAGAEAPDSVHERPAVYGAGWICGASEDYDREYCVDLVQLSAFLNATQPETAEALELDEDGPTRRKFLARLQGEITKRGTIDVLRNGIKHGAVDVDLFYGTPSPGNAEGPERSRNRFSVTRQLRYSRDETQLALDLGCSSMACRWPPSS
jgi:type I restriction enzyme R subunit